MQAVETERDWEIIDGWMSKCLNGWATKFTLPLDRPVKMSQVARETIFFWGIERRFSLMIGQICEMLAEFQVRQFCQQILTLAYT